MDPVVAKRIRSQYEKAPSGRTAQLELETLAYGTEVRGKKIDRLDNRQLYGLAKGVVRQAYNTPEPITLEDVPRRTTPLSRIDNSTLLFWKAMIEHEAGVQEDEMSFSRVDRYLVDAELEARIDWQDSQEQYGHDC